MAVTLSRITHAPTGATSSGCAVDRAVWGRPISATDAASGPRRRCPSGGDDPALMLKYVELDTTIH